jgi:hypothetical protein
LWMDGVGLELVCPCGFENFERVIVQRRLGSPVVTDFVACVGCRAMYLSPVPKPDPVPRRPGSHMQAIGGPEARPDSNAVLRGDAADAATDYRKPGAKPKR